MPELPDDFPDDVPEDVRDWFASDFGDEWDSAIFHGGPDGFWSVEIFYPDGTSEEQDLGYFDGEPADWVWDIFDWLDGYVGDDVDVSYAGE